MRDTEMFAVLWFFFCFMNFGFAIVAWIEGGLRGGFLAFLLSLLLVPLGPIATAMQWARFHVAKNEILQDIAEATKVLSQEVARAFQPEERRGLLAKALGDAEAAVKKARDKWDSP